MGGAKAKRSRSRLTAAEGRLGSIEERTRQQNVASQQEQGSRKTGGRRNLSPNRS